MESLEHHAVGDIISCISDPDIYLGQGLLFAYVARLSQIKKCLLTQHFIIDFSFKSCQQCKYEMCIIMANASGRMQNDFAHLE